MRTFARIFNIIGGFISTILSCIVGINRHDVGVTIVCVIIILLICLVCDFFLEKDIDFSILLIVVISWIAALVLLISGCYCSFKNAETYDRAIDAYNNGRYEDALNGFMEIEGMYDTDDYLENVVRLKGTDVEVIE